MSHYALLSNVTSPDTSDGSSSHPVVAPIVGGVVAGVMGCLIVLGLLFIVRRRRQKMRGVDRIHTGATTKEDIFDGPEGTIDPFNTFHYAGVPNSASTAYASSIDFSERTPLDLSQSGHTPTESWILVQNTSNNQHSTQAPSTAPLSPAQTRIDPNSKCVHNTSQFLDVN